MKDTRLGIDEVYGEVQPADKLALSQREGRVVAMTADRVSTTSRRPISHFSP